MKNFSIAVIAALALAFAGCVKNESQAPKKDYFNFSTKQISNLTVSYPAEAHFIVYLADPATNPDIKPIFKANTISGTYNGTIMLPAGVDKIYILTAADEEDNLPVAEVSVDGAKPIVVNMADYGIEPRSARSMRPDGPYECEWMGFLAFEDLWPLKGDYDMNDVGVEYACKVFFNADNTIIRIEDKFTPIRKGCSHRDGFGYQYNVAPDAIASVTMSRLALGDPAPVPYVSPYAVDSKGLEAGQTDKATFMIFDDVASEVNGPTFDYVGNQQSAKYKYIVDVVFSNPSLTMNEVGYPPYNPFISIDHRDGDSRRREVHLPEYRPTMKALADGADWFGKYDDRSDVNNNLWYVSEEQFPFALDLWIFSYPAERVRIDDYYPRFANWARTNGTQDWNWYYDHIVW